MDVDSCAKKSWLFSEVLYCACVMSFEVLCWPESPLSVYLLVSRKLSFINDAA